MRLIRERMDYEEFCEYTVPGLVVAIVIVLLVLLIGALAWGVDVIPDTRAERNIYLALKGEKVNDKTAADTAKLLNSLYHGRSFDLEELKGMEKAWEADGYFSIAMEHLDNVKLILEEAPEATEIKVRIPTWGDFFIPLGLGSWLLTAFSMSVSYLAASISERHREESIWTYPWDKSWSWPWVLLMFPFLVISQPILLTQYGIQKVRGVEEEEEEIEEVRGVQRIWEAPTTPPLSAQEHIDALRVQLRSKIASIREAREDHRQEWIKVCGQRLLEERNRIEFEVQSYRSRLSSLGQDIEKNQRGLAEAQSKLRDLEKAIESKRAEEEKEFALEFDKLLGIPHVEAVEAVEGEIRVYTNTIYIPYQGRKYEIGDFLIRIGTRRGGFIAAENLCNTSRCGRHHPYTWPYDSNQLCFGTLSGYIHKLLLQRDYLPLVIVLLQALRSAEGDRPEDVKYWKEVKQ